MLSGSERGGREDGKGEERGGRGGVGEERRKG